MGSVTKGQEVVRLNHSDWSFLKMSKHQETESEKYKAYQKFMRSVNIIKGGSEELENLRLESAVRIL